MNKLQSKRPTILLSALAASMLFAAACGGSAEVSIGENTVSKSEVEAKGMAAITKSVGQAPASIVCPSGLEAKVGATETCTLTDNRGQEYSMSATVTSAPDENDNVELDYKVANHPNGKT